MVLIKLNAFKLKPIIIINIIAEAFKVTRILLVVLVNI